jgi:hypothetical protein
MSNRVSVFGVGVYDGHFERRKEFLGKCLAAQDADIFALGEVPDPGELVKIINDSGDTQYEGQYAQNSCEGDSTLIAYPRAAKVGQIAILKSGGKKSYGPALLNVNGLNILGGKFCWPVVAKRERRRQYDAVADQIPDAPTVVIVDANSQCDGLANALGAEYKRLNPYAKTFPNGLGISLDPILSSARFGTDKEIAFTRLISKLLPPFWGPDQVFAKGMLEASAIAVPDFLSDHIANMVDLLVN